MSLYLTVSLLQKLIKQQHNEAGNEELDDDRSNVQCHCTGVRGNHHLEEILSAIK